MKKVIGLFIVVSIVMSACGPKPYYKTAEGRKKQKHYNSIQFGQEQSPKHNFNK